MFRRVLAICGLLALCGVLFIVTTTTPSTGGATTVLLLFILLYVVLIAALTFLIFWINRLIGRLFYSDKQSAVNSLSFRQAYYYATVFALAPVILVSMQSVGKSGPVEWLLVGFFLVLGYIYVSRQTR